MPCVWQQSELWLTPLFDWQFQRLCLTVCVICLALWLTLSDSSQTSLSVASCQSGVATAYMSDNCKATIWHNALSDKCAVWRQTNAPSQCKKCWISATGAAGVLFMSWNVPLTLHSGCCFIHCCWVCQPFFFAFCEFQCRLGLSERAELSQPKPSHVSSWTMNESNLLEICLSISAIDSFAGISATDSLTHMSRSSESIRRSTFYKFLDVIVFPTTWLQWLTVKIN